MTLDATGGPTRRNALGAAAGAFLGMIHLPLRATTTTTTTSGAGGNNATGSAAGSNNAVADVLDRPASPTRRPAHAPMLRITRCARRLVAVGERGLVLLSDDDGQRWQQAQVPVSVTLTGVQFTSAQRGFAIGHGGVVLRSDDAGSTWRRLFDGRQLPALLAPEAAQQARAEGPDKPWLALHFGSDQTGCVVGAFGLALQTSDGGQSWNSVADRLVNPRALHLHAVHQRADRVWVAGEQGFYAVSDDAGRSFTALPTPNRGSFFALHALDDKRVLLGGLRGSLLIHTGTNQFNKAEPASPQGVAQLLSLGPQNLALLDQAGRIFTAKVSDLAFTPYRLAAPRTWLSLAQAADGTLVGASFDGVARLPLPSTKT